MKNYNLMKSTHYYIISSLPKTIPALFFKPLIDMLDKKENLPNHLGTSPLQQQWIAEYAYYKALARGFSPNLDQEDWFEGLSEFERLIIKQPKNGLISLR